MELWPPKSWPALLVGLMLLTYWLRVLQMVRRTKKVAGHHANLIPEEKLGRMLRIVWIPAVALWIILPIMAAFGILTDVPPFQPLADSSMLAWPAVILAAVAYGMTWICWFRMGRSWRMGIDPNDKTQLVFGGPFAYVRNPIYGLSQLLMFLTIVIVPSVAMLLIGVIHILLMQWEVRREEIYLSALHGQSYVRYVQNVGRFLPRSLRAYRP